MVFRTWLNGRPRPSPRPRRGRPPHRTAPRLEALEARWLPSITIRTVPLQAKDLAYDPYSAQIYASVPGNAGLNGNSITPIEPVTATVGAAVFVGSEPGKLAASDDGSFLYVALDGASAVTRFNIPAQAPDLSFYLNPDGPPLFAGDLSVQPGNPNTVAIVRRNAGVAIYDDGVARPTVAGGSSSIAFSSDPTRIYGYNSDSTEFGFRRLTVDDSGVRVQDVTGGLVFGFNVTIKFDAGFVYSTHGEVVDPRESGGPPQLVGTIPVGFASSVVPDSASDRVWYLAGNQLLEYTESHLTRVAQYTLPSGGGSLIRWGDFGGLAYQNGTNVYLLNVTDDGPGPADATLVRVETATPLVPGGLPAAGHSFTAVPAAPGPVFPAETGLGATAVGAHAAGSLVAAHTTDGPAASDLDPLAGTPLGTL
jgi:hypothetical protein